MVRGSLYLLTSRCLDCRYLIVAALFSRAETSADYVSGLAAALPSLSAGGELISIDFPAVAMAVLGQVGFEKLREE